MAGGDRSEEIEVEVQLSETLFMEKEIREMEGYRRGPDYVEVKCGCTSRRYGDSTATLRVHANGQFLIFCHCIACKGETFRPHEFEKHSEKEGSSKWKSHIWVMIGNKKVGLCRTPLVNYYKHIANGASGSITRNFHRDEFITCCACNKQRRFRLRNKDECRIYHDALLNKRWNCADWPYHKIMCNDDEERVSRKNCRGCPANRMCEGCTSCVCFGCLKCRFLDCNCRTCADFMQNAEP